MNYKKVSIFALLILLTVFTISGCSSSEEQLYYEFILPQESIASISVVQIRKTARNPDVALTKTPFCMEVISTISEQDWNELIHTIKSLPCCYNADPPHQLTEGDIGIKVLYLNGEYEIFCGEVIAVHQGERYYNDGLRFCEASSLDSVINKYLVA